MKTHAGKHGDPRHHADDIAGLKAENEALKADLRVQVLTAMPGDLVVLSFPQPLSHERAERIGVVWQDICPGTDVRCVVLDTGGHVDSVIRRPAGRPADWKVDL